MEVVHFHRRPQPTQFSVEGYFERLRIHLQHAELGERALLDGRERKSHEIHVRMHMMPKFSSGIIGRLHNILSAWQNQGDVNHITGDVHYIALLLRKNRTLLTVLDCEILERLTGWRRSLVKLLWYTLPSKRVSAMTVISQETKRQLLKEVQFPAENIHVIPVSVSPLFQPSPKAFNAEYPRILQVGTKVNKNVKRLAQALKGIQCHMDIVGPIDEELRKTLEENEIEFTQYPRLTEDELVERYRQADIISFVSTCEGFGMPIVEAQCVERVCVTSNRSSLPEVAGDGACLVDPFDVNSIRIGFLRVTRDAVFRENLLEAGRTNRLRFREKDIAARYANLYQQIIAKRSST